MSQFQTNKTPRGPFFSGLMATPLDSPNERTPGPGLSSHYGGRGEGGASGYGSIAGRHGINMDDDFNDYSDGEGSYNPVPFRRRWDIEMSERGDLEEDDEDPGFLQVRTIGWSVGMIMCSLRIAAAGGGDGRNDLRVEVRKARRCNCCALSSRRPHRPRKHWAAVVVAVRRAHRPRLSPRRRRTPAPRMFGGGGGNRSCSSGGGGRRQQLHGEFLRPAVQRHGRGGLQRRAGLERRRRRRRRRRRDHLLPPGRAGRRHSRGRNRRAASCSPEEKGAEERAKTTATAAAAAHSRGGWARQRLPSRGPTVEFERQTAVPWPRRTPRSAASPRSTATPHERRPPPSPAPPTAAGVRHGRRGDGAAAAGAGGAGDSSVHQAERPARPAGPVVAGLAAARPHARRHRRGGDDSPACFAQSSSRRRGRTH